MKFSCSKEQLDRQLQHISRIITVRHSLPVLSNILLETDEKILRISGTDLELAMTTHIPAEVEQEGTFTVPAKIFQEFIHQNPDDSIHFKLEGYELICTSDKVEARISGIDPEEYPPLPKVEQGRKLTLPLKDFIEAVKQVVIAAAADQSRPAPTGIQALFHDETVVLAATDSFRLVERKIRILPVQETFTLLIPARSIQEIIRISGSLPEIEDLEVEVSGEGDSQQVLFRIGDIELYSRLLTGAFPKYQAIIPTETVAIAQVVSSEFIQALRLSYVFSQSGVANVLLNLGEDGTLTLSSYGSQRGSTKHTVYAIVEEGFSPLRVAFNAKFLLDACQAANTSHITLRFSGATKPLVLATEDPDYVQLVMPIRLDS